MNILSLSRTLTGALAALGLASGLAAQWDVNYGTLISQSDDQLIQNQPLAFSFPYPGGSTSAISLSTNGWIKLTGTTSTTSSELSESVSTLLSGDPRIAVLWDDLTGTTSGAVVPQGLFFNSLPNRAIVTWRMREFGTTSLVDVQLQLFPSGAFSIFIARGGNDAIVGVSPGNGAVDPGANDLSAGVIGGAATVYEQFSTGTNDLNGQILLFNPNASNGYDMIATPGNAPFASKNLYGDGCPASFTSGGAFYELFDATSNPFDLTPSGPFALYYTNTGNGYGVTPCVNACFEPNYSNIVTWGSGTGDDSLSGPLSLGFTANFGGISTSQIEVCSNGFIWLVAGSSTSADYTEDATEFATEPARLAVLWDDLNNSQTSSSGGGTVYFDTFPASGSTPARAVITWDQIPEFGNVSSVNTVQATLYANGDIVSSYQQVMSLDALVGFSVGNLGAAPPATDISANPVSFLQFAQVNRQPMTLDLLSGTLATLGATADYECTQLNGGLAAVLHVSSAPAPGNDLTFLGMTGCSFHAAPNLASGPMSISGDTATLSLPVPNVASLAGVRLYHQAIAFAPGINPLNIIASNGLEVTLGY
jgi:hypothetical protein